MTRVVETIDASVPARKALATFVGASQTHRAYPVVRGRAFIAQALVPYQFDLAVASAHCGLCRNEAGLKTTPMPD